MPRSLTLFRAAVVLVAISASARPASASPIFPGIVEEVVGASAPPPCTVCHATPLGGLGTATTPLGTYLRSRGLVANDEGSLRSALQAMIGENHDSDGDGIPDATELKDGTDPNGAGGAPAEKYGCGAHVAPGGSRGTSWLAVGAGALLLTVARRRARRGSNRRRGV